VPGPASRIFIMAELRMWVRPCVMELWCVCACKYNIYSGGVATVRMTLCNGVVVHVRLQV
jgi:hypothetical protein